MERSALNKQQSISSKEGFIMIEAIIGVVLASIFLTAFLKLNMEAVKLNRANVSNFKASMYLKELIEITKDLEQSDWNELVKPDPDDPTESICYLEPHCHPEIVIIDNKYKWKLIENDSDNPESWDISFDSDTYSRSIMVENVYRNQLIFPNEIVPKTTPGAELDSDTKKITAKIIWNDGSHSPMKLETYVYDFND